MLIANENFNFRIEYFGGLAWSRSSKDSSGRKIYKLDESSLVILFFYLKPRDSQLFNTSFLLDFFYDHFGLNRDDLRNKIENLKDEGLLQQHKGHYLNIERSEQFLYLNQIVSFIYTEKEQLTKEIVKPIWVHIQPFTFCNQKCLHCYCNGGPQASKFILSTDTWLSILNNLESYGIMDVYLSGGETFLLDESLFLIEEIIKRGFVFGTSTNATIITDQIISKISSLKIKKIQVSLDASNPKTYNSICGSKGDDFSKAIHGIKLLSSICTPVINTVVNKNNINELKEIVELGIGLGCKEFKFFPQKKAGRSKKLNSNYFLKKEEIVNQLIPKCKYLSKIFGVLIDTVNHIPCGSGRSGFTINQHGDIYPCIFGVEDQSQRCGSILQNNINEVWFNSLVLNRFRGQNSFPCSACEST